MPKQPKTKYIFVVGGVMSSVGKGIAAASISKILQARGYKVTAVKADPYVNVDAGTMNPTEHGEVFVTEDGDECDQDIGNYERFLDTNIYSSNYMTWGRVNLSVIEKERNLEYGGHCVEVVPHIPEEIIRRIKASGEKVKADIVVTEIGGTVGEYQNILFLEAGRMLKVQNPEDVIFVMVSYLPIPKTVGEMKTKPTQYAVRTLNSAGIQPDFILCRAETSLDQKRKTKIGVFCNVTAESVISAPDIDNIYQVPINFDKENLGEKILAKLKLKSKKNNLQDWQKLVKRVSNISKTVKIAMVGKYFSTGKFVSTDSYISVIESIKHACWYNNVKPDFTWIDAEQFEGDKKKLQQLSKYDGIVVPGGFGKRGTEGMILAAEYARKNKIPYFGLCLGMQIMTIEFARHLADLKDANSTELNPKTTNPVIHTMADQVEKIKNKNFGATMRLGAYQAQLIKGTIAHKAYKQDKIFERHRHRYEFNNDYKYLLEEKGLRIAGVNPQQNLVEIVEVKNHPFMVGVQFHPEFKSRPLIPHPLFREFIKASLKK